MAKSENSELEDLIREYVREVVKEFTGVGAIAGYTLPLGMAMDPETLSTRPKIKGKWPKPNYGKKKKKR